MVNAKHIHGEHWLDYGVSVFFDVVGESLMGFNELLSSSQSELVEVFARIGNPTYNFTNHA